MKTPETVLKELVLDQLTFDAGPKPQRWRIAEFKYFVEYVNGHVLSDDVWEAVPDLHQVVNWHVARQARESLHKSGIPKPVSLWWLASHEGWREVIERTEAHKAHKGVGT